MPEPRHPVVACFHIQSNNRFFESLLSDSEMDILNLPSNQERCHNTYGYLETRSPSSKTVFCTLAIIVLTICIEVLANGRLDYCNATEKQDEEEASILVTEAPLESSAIAPITAMTVSDQPQLQPEIQAESQAMSEVDDPHTTKIDSDATKPDLPPRAFCCYEDPSPLIRANRLVVGTILFSLVLAVFIIRIQEATTRPYIDFLCWSIIHPPPPNWTAIVFLNIIPFTCAAFAFLRTLVDCVLVRWGTGLSYDTKKIQRFWTPLMPFMIIFCAGYMLLECFKVPIACLMGDREVSLWTAKKKDNGKSKMEDIELQGEETQGLVDNIDGPEDAIGNDVYGPPAYDEVCTSVERPEKGSMT
ncbi:hypothetical protein BKA66DRAFT_260778 [Pyrenochaeta sp. MPI-SDFR-AT-0127]|nr:hypothetical protein BKA66DRAFT_260778 [Pyrenochaeta sp. MPI-SDFR-AT-0127]